MKFFALAGYSRPGLYVWRPNTNVRRFVKPASESPDDHGWYCFECSLDTSMAEAVHFKLYQRAENDSPAGDWESDEHNRVLPRGDLGQFPDDVWFAQGAGRVLPRNPMAGETDTVRIHLITAKRYRQGKLFIWTPDTASRQTLDLAGHDEIGPYWDVELTGRDRHIFSFKFLRSVDSNVRYEPSYANRIYSSADGTEVWTHSEGREILARRPQKKTLTVRFQQRDDGASPERMHLWQEASNLAIDIDAAEIANGWSLHTIPLYTGIPYRFKFHNEEPDAANRWEHDQATSEVVLQDDREVWKLEGERHLFAAEPKADRAVTVRISQRPPATELASELFAHVWINQARFPLHQRVPGNPEDSSKFTFTTYPHVTTSFKFTDGVRWEDCSRHALDVSDAPVSESYVVLGRPPLLREPPPPHLFEDPPFWIRRPGTWEEDAELRFALHAPAAARARLIGDWTNGAENPIEMRSTVGGSYWWATVPVAALESALPSERNGSYHGARYKFLLNDDEAVQDPAAGWVEQTWTQGNSLLVKHSAFPWHDDGWRTPAWDYLTIYQIHPQRFSNRFTDLAPLVRVAREIDEPSGYIRDLGITAILLMPVNEVGSNNSWGYDPAYFYAVERDYGGPNALKTLVDTCHRHGIAVLLDLVFNHAGSDDNILWRVSRETYFDGDTRWGAMINFDHPQSRHFFEQNLVYLRREFHIDGFRLDHTHTIVHSHHAGGFVRVAGSGGGWMFLHGLRHALHRDADPRAILTAEHLPNEWQLTNYGGPMDSQWCDDFHDRLVDACKGHQVMGRLADAMKLSHTVCQQWYNVTNYAESHDEVGNVNDRIANVAGFGRGLRMSKVAAAASILARGIPMFFMGAESGEHRQFKFGSADTLDLTHYQNSQSRSRVRAWWTALCKTRHSNTLKGPAKLDVRYAHDQQLAFSRGLGDDYFVVLNFGGWSGWKSLAELNLPQQRYRELWNSTWPAFRVEDEDEHGNGGHDARLDRDNWLHVPDFGAVILERV